jgi:anti-sigma-K factor RskA
MRRRRDAADVAELAALADGSIAPERRADLEARVAASTELADALAEQQRALVLSRGAASEVEAPAGLRARVEAQRTARSGWAPPRRALAVGAVGVGAVVVAVAIGVSVIRSNGSSEQFRAALGATPLAPGASGSATLTKTTSGWRIALDASALPRLGRGRFYEAWLKNGAGVLVPVGTFNEGRKVTLWAGVSPRSFATLTVTRERADGDRRSSGEKVLSGTVDASG